MSEKKFDQMNATEKTAFLGFRSYSQKEQKQRERDAIRRGSELTIKFMTDLLAVPDLVVSKYSNEDTKEKNYKEVINILYNFAFNNGYRDHGYSSIICISCRYCPFRDTNDRCRSCDRWGNKS